MSRGWSRPVDPALAVRNPAGYRARIDLMHADELLRHLRSLSHAGLALHELTADPNYVPPSISLRRNPVLESLDGLQSLAAQPGLDITILDSPKLTNLDALSGATSFGDLSFVRVTALTSLRALGAAKRPPTDSASSRPS